jgi:hypothetical protein
MQKGACYSTKNLLTLSGGIGHENNGVLQTPLMVQGRAQHEH